VASQGDLLPRFEQFGLEPGDPSIVELPRSGRGRRWESGHGVSGRRG